MRIARFFFGFTFLAAGVYLIIAAHQKYGSSSDPIQAALLRQNSALVTAVDQGFFKGEQRIQEVILRSLRKDPATATILAQSDSPRVILYGNEKIKASDFLLDAQLLRALEVHRQGSEKYKIYSRDGIQFVLMKGEIQNQTYVAAFLEGALFADLGVGEAMRVWIASSSGELLFHSVKRLMGSQVVNLRPVAAGMEMLAKQEPRNLVSRYTGFEGGEALGAWSADVKRGLVIGVEWASHFGRDTTIDVPFFAGIVMICAGFFLLGTLVRRNNKKIAERFQFDPASLDDDIIEYLEENRRSTEEAVTYAQKKEAEVAKLEKEMTELGAAQNDLEWRFSCYESLFEQIAGSSGKKQVLRGLAEVISRRMLSSPVVFYRFSPTSFSLVPDWVAGADRLSAEAKEFLSDSRIFIGNFRLIGGIHQVTSFNNWNRSLAKYMSGNGLPVFLPMETDGFRGAVAILLPEGANEHGELNEPLAFFRQLVQVCAWLIQSQDDVRFGGKAVASTPNRLGNQAQAAQT